MKITDRELKKEAKKTHHKILNDNKDWYKALAEEKYGHSAKPASKKPKFRLNAKLLGFATSFALVIALTITLLVIFLPSGTDIPSKTYFRENENTKTVELSTILEDMHKSTIEVDIVNIIKISLIYDSVSNDTLYYRIDIDDQNSLCSAKLYIVCNKDYAFTFQMPSTIQTNQINGFEMEYKIVLNMLDEYLYTEESSAIITTGKEIIYVEYSGLCLNEEGNFINWIEGIVKTK